MKRNTIVIHTNELGRYGVDVKPVSRLTDATQAAHRDDHYMFILLQSGRFVWEVDFKEIVLSGPSVCFIAPGQVHRYIHFKDTTGWLVFISTEFISTQNREIFEAYQNLLQSVAIGLNDAVFSTIPIIEDVLQQELMPLRRSLLGSLIDALSALVASHILQTQNAVNLIGGQKYKTVVRFKQLVRERYRELKQVQAYAVLLNITPLYLNEVAREITGFPASYWINQEILLEAKRMLYYTVLDVKQIAFELGYDDHAYFSRFFKKHTDNTPLAFRTAKPLFVQSSP